MIELKHRLLQVAVKVVKAEMVPLKEKKVLLKVKKLLLKNQRQMKLLLRVKVKNLEKSLK